MISSGICSYVCMQVVCVMYCMHVMLKTFAYTGLHTGFGARGRKLSFLKSWGATRYGSVYRCTETGGGGKGFIGNNAVCVGGGVLYSR